MSVLDAAYKMVKARKKKRELPEIDGSEPVRGPDGMIGRADEQQYQAYSPGPVGETSPMNEMSASQFNYLNQPEEQAAPSKIELVRGPNGMLMQKKRGFMDDILDFLKD